MGEARTQRVIVFKPSLAPPGTGMDTVVVLGPVQHLLWDRIPGPPAELQQPCARATGAPHLRGQESEER